MTDDNISTTQSTGTNDSSSFETIKKELEKTQEKLTEMTTISQRALADLQNYKRRVEEEKSTFVAFANAALFNELLPSIQNMERALQHEPKDTEWVKGAEQTIKQLLGVCEKMGLKPIETVGKPFDPTLHEALLTGPGPKDQIMEELEKGYMLGDRILKASRVKVGNGEEAQNAPSNNQTT